MTEPIRVAFVLHVMQVAGAEVLVAETIRRLGAQIEPVVLCLDGVGQLGDTMRAEGVPVVALSRRPGLDVSVSARLAGQIRRRHVEVVHAHQYTPFFYSALARLQCARPVHVIFTEHGRHYPDIVSTRRRLVNRCLLSRLADEVTGVCQFSVRALAERDGFGHVRLDVIENGIDLARYHRGPDGAALRARLGLDPTRLYVTCVARFHAVKDHRTLLHAFSRVAAARHDVDLLLGGDGPLRPDLEALAASLGLTTRVRFLGVREDVPDLLAASDVFVLTSLSEAASLTLLEARASSLPVVVTDVGGNAEIVRAGIDGLLAPRGDAGAVARALLQLLDDGPRRRTAGAAARARVEERYQLDTTIQSYYRRYAAAADRLRHATGRRLLHDDSPRCGV